MNGALNVIVICDGYWLAQDTTFHFITVHCNAFVPIWLFDIVLMIIPDAGFAVWSFAKLSCVAEMASISDGIEIDDDMELESSTDNGK